MKQVLIYDTTTLPRIDYFCLVLLLFQYATSEEMKLTILGGTRHQFKPILYINYCTLSITGMSCLHRGTWSATHVCSHMSRG